MQHHQIPLVDIGGDKKVQALRLIDERRAVGGEIEQPALVDLEAGLEHALFLRAEEIEVLHAAALFQDRIPHRVGILALPVQQGFEIGVLDREIARQGLVGVDIGRDRFDAGAGAAADDADRSGGRNRHLAGKAFHRPGFRRIRAGAAFLRQQQAGFIGAGRDVLEHLQVPRLGHGAFHADALGLEEGVEPHHPQPDAAFAAGGIARTGHFGRGAVDIILQHIIEEAHHILDHLPVALPFIPFFEVERARQHTAVRSLPRWSRPVGRVISLHRLEVDTFSPSSR